MSTINSGFKFGLFHLQEVIKTKSKDSVQIKLGSSTLDLMSLCYKLITEQLV